MAPYCWFSCLEHISAVYSFRDTHPVCEQIDRHNSKRKRNKRKRNIFIWHRGKRNHFHCYSSNTCISCSSIMKVRSVFTQAARIPYNLAQTIYSFKSIWMSETSLRECLQTCKQILNEPHATRPREGKNPGQRQKLYNIIHRYSRNF